MSNKSPHFSSRDPRSARDVRSSRDLRDSRSTHDSRDSRRTRDLRDSRDFRSERDPRLSRRARPAKSPLSVDAILAAALDLMAREGLEGLSLRKVAAALDTGPASLYVYVDNHDSLLSLMFDRALGKVVIPPNTKGGWRERLSAVMLSYLKALMSMPGLGQLALTRAPSGPNSLRVVEAILAFLREGGVDDARAAWALDILLLQFTAIAAERDMHRRQPSPLGTMQQVIAEVAPETHPNIHALGEKLFMGAPHDRVRWALDALINGILGTPCDKSE